MIGRPPSGYPQVMTAQAAPSWGGGQSPKYGPAPGGFRYAASPNLGPYQGGLRTSGHNQGQYGASQNMAGLPGIGAAMGGGGQYGQGQGYGQRPGMAVGEAMGGQPPAPYQQSYRQGGGFPMQQMAGLGYQSLAHPARPAQPAPQQRDWRAPGLGSRY